jgi:aryl carrier-like protein
MHRDWLIKKGSRSSRILSLNAEWRSAFGLDVDFGSCAMHIPDPIFKLTGRLNGIFW